MKKIILLLFLVLSLNDTHSQVAYFNYLDYTSEWRYYGGGWSGLNFFDTYETKYFDGDETINGITYYKEYSKSVVTEYNPPFGFTYSTEYFNGPSYIREDATGKFYRLNADGTENIILDNQEILNSQIGDTFPNPGNECVVQSIEMVNLGSIPLKKIKGVNQWNDSGTLEGIGFLGLACSSAIETGYGMNCYTKQGISLQFGTKDCNSFPTPIRTNLSTYTDNLDSDKIVVYPNPTNGILKIDSNLQKLTNYEICSIQGASLKTGSFVKTEEINISDLKAGVYIIKISSQHSNAFKKIIKE